MTVTVPGLLSWIDAPAGCTSSLLPLLGQRVTCPGLTNGTTLAFDIGGLITGAPTFSVEVDGDPEAAGYAEPASAQGNNSVTVP
jgi:hypothetical protein